MTDEVNLSIFIQEVYNNGHLNQTWYWNVTFRTGLTPDEQKKGSILGYNPENQKIGVWLVAILLEFKGRVSDVVVSIKHIYMVYAGLNFLGFPQIIL